MPLSAERQHAAPLGLIGPSGADLAGAFDFLQAALELHEPVGELLELRIRLQLGSLLDLLALAGSLRGLVVAKDVPHFRRKRV